MADKPNWDDYNRGVVEEFRANGGKVGGDFANASMLILTCTGAKSGQPRTIPLVYSRDGERIVIIASKAGLPTHPDWYHNLVAHPDATLEIGTEKFPVHATVESGTERQRLFDQAAALMPVFKEYEKKAPREIPVITLKRT